ncbi:hypothetical protein PGTUg99_028659 [Puccinia graminis f. sp. tritici]|uniref:Uncharacterized protein n=1 Tax=Puccinia graminis f. sp. tritici TaxID=56615 RepID=A0A5B0MZ56_PUCGR|nr:hypothetical protein PGTUg99_028659 [Puccinia graminis f. sp. tritici]
MIIAPSEPNSGGLVVYFATSRGIANVLTGPIAGGILQRSSSTKAGYKSLVFILQWIVDDTLHHRSLNQGAVSYLHKKLNLKISCLQFGF